MYFQYQSQNGSNQTQIQFTLNLVALLEYPSPNDSSAYQPNGTYVQRWPVEHQIVQWGFWRNESVVVDDTLVYIFSVTSQDGIFTLRTHVAPVELTVGQGMLSPNSIKVDIEVHEFPFVGNDTRLALQTLLTSQTQSQNNGQNAIDNNNLFLSNMEPNMPLGSFSWVPIANGNDSSVIKVVATTAQRAYGNQFDLFFSFLTDAENIHSDIVWDPTIGLAYTGTAPTSPAEFCFIMCGTMGIVFIVIIAVVVIAIFGAVVLCLVGRPKGDGTYQRID